MSNDSNPKNFTKILMAIPFVLIVLLAIHSGPDYDFKVFYTAGEAVLHGHKPLTWNPPWMALIFAPLSLLPIEVAYPVYVCISIVGFAIVLRHLGCNPYSTEENTDLALAASPFMVPYANACSLVV